MIYSQVADNLYRGSEPLTAADIGILRDLGVTTIVNLQVSRTPRDAMWAIILDKLTEYCLPCFAFFPPSITHVSQALTVIGNAEGKVYVHCRQGVDRTGYVIAMYRVHREQWSYDAAIKEMANAGMHKRFFWWTWFL